MQFLADAEAMGLDRLDAQLELAGDLAGGVAVADQLEDFEFAVRQHPHARLELGRFAIDRAGHQHRGQFVADAHLAFHHLAQRAHDLLGSLQLGDVALRPGGESPGGVQRLLVHRGDKDGNQGVGGPEAADEIEPAGPVFQGDIHDHRVGATGLHCLQGPGEISRFTTDAEISGPFEQRSHAGPENRVVVHQ